MLALGAPVVAGMIWLGGHLWSGKPAPAVEVLSGENVKKVPPSKPEPPNEGEKARAEEKKSWADAVNAGTRAAFEKYLRQFPGGIHAAEASERIAHLDAAERDDRAWTEALRLGTVESFEQYLAQLPNGLHGADAREKIRKLETKQAEERAWIEAMRLGSIAGFSRYLDQFPNGDHAAEARDRIAKLRTQEQLDERSWAEAARRDSIETFNQYLARFPAGKHVSEARDRIVELKAEIEREEAAWADALRAGTVRAFNEYRKQFPHGGHTTEANERMMDKLQFDLGSDRAGRRTAVLEDIIATGDADLLDVALGAAIRSSYPDVRCRAIRIKFTHVQDFRVELSAGDGSAKSVQDAQANNSASYATVPSVGYDYATGRFQSTRWRLYTGNVSCDGISFSTDNICMGTLRNTPGTWEFHGRVSCRYYQGTAPFNGLFVLN